MEDDLLFIVDTCSVLMAVAIYLLESTLTHESLLNTQLLNIA
jgi:hypothetical protein